MEALRAPVAALRRRLNRGIALQRAVPAAEVDAQAVRNFWSALSTEVRMEVLRFTDSTIVQRVHDYMIKLLKADIWSRMNDVSIDDDVPAPRLTGFEFEAPAERDCLGSLRAPIAIMATEEFAADEHLLQTLEQTLGSSMLEGRPALQRKDWSTVFDVSPSCWEELQDQVYRLVELAIFHAERDPYFQLMRDAPPQPRSRGRRKVKRPGTKKAKGAASRPSGEQKAEASENTTAASTTNDTTAMTEDNHKLGEREGEVKDLDVQSARSEDDEEADRDEADLEPSHEDVKSESSESGRRQRAVDARFQRPRLRWDSGGEATCFQWLPDLFQDGGQFQLMQYRHRDPAESDIPIARAFVRNTFVHVEVLEEHDKPSELRRSASERIL